MPDGFDYDPAAIRAFAEVFAEASAQVSDVRATAGQPSATAADFGAAWTEHGADFARNMALVAEDLGKLAGQLGAISGQLNQGTDLIVQADTSTLRHIQAIDDGSGGGE